MAHQDKGHLEVEDRGAVLIVRVDGGPHSVFGLDIANQLEELVDRVDRDPSVHAVVFTGAHPERFVSHADVRWLQAGGPRSRRSADAAPPPWFGWREAPTEPMSWSPWCAGPRCGEPSSSTDCTRRSCG
jgi:enoyl-CoA hydratase/carnithine racemase